MPGGNFKSEGRGIIMKIYKISGFILMLLFAITGLLFLFLPDQVLILFNTLSLSFKMPQFLVTGWSFYLILAVGYMYAVTILAFLMFKHPDNRYFPLLLIHAKLASSVLSLALFLVQAHYLIYLANFIIDGAIGLIILSLFLRMRKSVWAYA
jgi:hypothetical protein